MIIAISSPKNFFVVNFETVARTESCEENLLFECEATTDIIKDKLKFINFDNSFTSETHSIELANGSRKKGEVSGKRDACTLLHEINNSWKMCVSTYNENIFSVQTATDNGAPVCFFQILPV